jgi:hypothetical protein
MVQRILKVLLMSGLIAAFTTATQAMQSDGHEGGEQDQQSIVGSWIGINETGERWLTSFTSDGIALNSVQSEVSTTRPVGVLTPAHGVWAQVGKRQFAITEVALFYDIQTGELQYTGKLRGVLTLDKNGDALSGSVTAEAFGPDGNLAFTLTHTLRFSRIKVEAVD